MQDATRLCWRRIASISNGCYLFDIEDNIHHFQFAMNYARYDFLFWESTFPIQHFLSRLICFLGPFYLSLYICLQPIVTSTRLRLSSRF